ncbi:MAG: DUF5658 family protein [Phycisphaerales bacterium]
MLATASDPAALAPANTSAVAPAIERPARPRKSRLPGRPTRVAALIITILFVSVADLILTLTFLTSVGMAEANPLARKVFATNSVPVVVGFKLEPDRDSVTAACGWPGTRRSARAEPGRARAHAGCSSAGTCIDQSHVFTTVLNAPEPHHHADSRWVAIVE